MANEISDIVEKVGILPDEWMEASYSTSTASTSTSTSFGKGKKAAIEYSLLDIAKLYVLHLRRTFKSAFFRGAVIRKKRWAFYITTGSSNDDFPTRPTPRPILQSAEAPGPLLGYRFPVS